MNMLTKIFYTRDEQTAAQKVNIADFLQSINYELTRYERSFKGKIHDSLVIQNDGRWAWNSRDLRGNSPIELYKHILLNDYGYTDEKSAYIEAIKQLAGTNGAYTAHEKAQISVQVRPPGVPLQLPEKNYNNDRVIKYLCEIRGLDRNIILGLIKWGKIYEDIHHNAVFVSYDKNNTAQNAFLRGTFLDKPFKKNAELSDKSYPFTLLGYVNSSRVYCFESALCCASHNGNYEKLTHM
jgi:hypothetical protein